jgi:hypothetical protein
VSKLLLLLLLFLLLGVRAPAAAQGPPVSLRLEEGGAALVIGPVLADRELADAAGSGLPIRLRVRAELWRDKFIDELTAESTWSIVLAFEPLSRRFFVRATTDDEASRVFASFDAARAAVERAYLLRISPRREGRYYYTASLEIETLSVSDLQELERWLQGDLRPAVGGDQSIPGALGDGAKRLLIRVLGVPSRRFEARTARFRVPRAADQP